MTPLQSKASPGYLVKPWSYMSESTQNVINLPHIWDLLVGWHKQRYKATYLMSHLNDKVSGQSGELNPWPTFSTTHYSYSFLEQIFSYVCKTVVIKKVSRSQCIISCSYYCILYQLTFSYHICYQPLSWFNGHNIQYLWKGETFITHAKQFLTLILKQLPCCSNKAYEV